MNISRSCRACVRAETDSEIFYIISSSASPGNRIREPAQALAASSRGWVAAPPLVVGGHVAGDCVPNLMTSMPSTTYLAVDAPLTHLRSSDEVPHLGCRARSAIMLKAHEVRMKRKLSEGKGRVALT